MKDAKEQEAFLCLDFRLPKNYGRRDVELKGFIIQKSIHMSHN